ncbi:MAG: rRNA maturation RNase YbeY [Candidatus Staskawiczbacteria bacterium]|nr:rRNA maturation RNase YbeY [Candidatus Staskawiczbacteria bacterium]
MDKRIFSTVAKKVLSGENRRTENISLAFVEKGEIKKLNKKFRNKNKPTDVLSFNLGERGYLGEIVICPEIVAGNAKKYGKTIKSEMIKVFVHGILHLLGYDHEKSKAEEVKMQEREEVYLSKI